MIQIHVTENDIIRSIKNTKYAPHTLSLARHLRCENDKLDISAKEVRVWIYDDSDYIEYNFASEEDANALHNFIDAWNLFIDSGNEEFNVPAFKFNLEEKHDPRNGSRYWAATNFDIERITSRDYSNSKEYMKYSDDDYDEDE